MTDRDLLRSAHHEAAHAVLIRDTGRGIAEVSIRPGLSHAGVTLPDPLTPEMRVLADAAQSGRHPLDGLMPEASRFAMREIVGMLAGKTAAEIVAPTLGYQPPTPEPDDPIELPAVQTPPARQPSVRLLAAEADTEDEVHDDDAIALEAAFRLVGHQTIGGFLAWMRAEARAAVERRWAAIETVATALVVAPHFLDRDAFEAAYTPPRGTP